MKTTFYAVLVLGDVEPTLSPAFETEAERDTHARALRTENDPMDGIYWLDIDATGRPDMGAYTGGFFDAPEVVS